MDHGPGVEDGKWQRSDVGRRKNRPGSGGGVWARFAVGIRAHRVDMLISLEFGVLPVGSFRKRDRTNAKTQRAQRTYTKVIIRAEHTHHFMLTKGNEDNEGAGRRFISSDG